LSTPLPLKIGDQIDGKYRISGVLGQGAMGCVYEATHELLGDQVAIKCLLAASPSPSGVQRFLREAQVVRAIRSPHAVKVLDVGLLPDGNPFLVMERLHGHDLDEQLRACGALPLGQTVELIIQLCDVLAEAHQNGVIHRDLKPSNLFLAGEPGGLSSLKVLDFGIAKVLPREGSLPELARTKGPVGTPLYMSPEQIKNEPLDARSDLWAVGVLIFQMLTERLPFEADSIEGLAVKICTEDPRRLDELRPGLPPEVGRLVAWCLARTPGGRPPSVAAIVDALAPLASPAVTAQIERVRRVIPDDGAPALRLPVEAVTAPPSTVRPASPATLAASVTHPAPVSDPGPLSREGNPLASGLPSPPAAPGPRKAPLLIAGLVAVFGAAAFALRPSPPSLATAEPAAPVNSSPAVPSEAAPATAAPVVVFAPPPASSGAAVPPATSSVRAPARSPRGTAPAALPSPAPSPGPSPPTTATVDPRQAAMKDRK